MQPSDSPSAASVSAIWARLGAVAGLLSFACVLIGVLRQQNDLAGLLLDAASTLLAGAWIFGLYAVQSRRIARLGLAGAIAAELGIALIVGLKLAVVVAQGQDGVASLMDRPAVPILYATSAGLFVWGLLALGTASLQARVIPWPAVVLLTLGLALSFFSNSPVVQVASILGLLGSLVVLWRGAPPRASAEEDDPRAAASAPGPARLMPLDALRGTIMALMAIDHASYFVRRWHPFETWDQPLPDYPTLGAMLTRLATHPCAPGFYFLMGAGMILFADSRLKLGWSVRRIAGHLALRGLLLIVLEQVIVDPATSGQIYLLEFSILSGLGVAMLLAIPFLRLHGWALAGAGAAIILAMQWVPSFLLDADLGALSWVRLLLVPGSVGPAFSLYAPIPWLGVVLVGMGFARLLQRDVARAYRVGLAAGLVSLALFLPLRLLGEFGNLRMPGGATVIDFFNLVKYPPSLTFLLLTLGFDLVLLFAFWKADAWLAGWGRGLVTLGKAALFFFLVHWLIYRVLALYFPQPEGLPETYAVWAVGLVLLYPVCRAYDRFKHRTAPGSGWRMV